MAAGTTPTDRTTGEVETRLPVWRTGVVAGTVGMLCCVGPVVLALIGAVGAGTAFVWATALYDGYTWWFRVAGLVVLVGLVVWALRRRRACTVAGVRRRRLQLLGALAVAVGTYALLYAVTTWLGTFAS